MDKIKTISRIAKLLFWIGFYLTPLAIITFWLSNGMTFQYIHLQIHSFNLPGVETLTPLLKFFGFLVTLLPTAGLMFVFYFVARLFQAYEHGLIFEIKNATYIRNIGLTILIWEIVRPFYDILISVVFTYQTTQVQYNVAFDPSNVGEIIVSILLIVVGWVMLEANKLKEEQEFTV